MAPDMRLPDKSTDWTHGTFELGVSGADGDKFLVQGFVKHGYGVSRGETPGSSPRLSFGLDFWTKTGGVTVIKIPPPAKLLPDGRGAWIYPLTFGRARLVVGPVGSPVLDDGW